MLDSVVYFVPWKINYFQKSVERSRRCVLHLRNLVSNRHQVCFCLNYPCITSPDCDGCRHQVAARLGAEPHQWRTWVVPEVAQEDRPLHRLLRVARWKDQRYQQTKNTSQQLGQWITFLYIHTLVLTCLLDISNSFAPVLVIIAILTNGLLLPPY